MQSQYTPERIARFWASLPERPDVGCWPSTVSHHFGSGVRPYRMAWEIVAGSVPDGFEVCHACDYTRCCRNDDPGIYIINGIARPRFGHLWLGTHRENLLDMVLKRRNHNARLTAEAARQIVAIPRGTMNNVQIAAAFGVSESHVSRIRSGTKWGHVTGS